MGDHCSALPKAQCFKVVSKIHLPFVSAIARARVNPILASLSWPVVEVSHSFLEVIMNSKKPEDNKAFTTAEYGQSTSPEDPEVGLHFNNSLLEQHTLTMTQY